MDNDRDIFPLLECLSSVTIALGAGFAPFAPPVFARCLAILHQNLAQINSFANGESVELPEKDFLITALDLLSGLVQGLRGEVHQLIEQSQPPLMQLLQMCFKDEVQEVRQSAYALLGDLVMNCFSDVRPHLTAIMSELVTQLEVKPEHHSVCNNAAWSAGEICLQAGPEMLPWVEPLLQRLVSILRASSTPTTVLENAAITIGRLGLACPTEVAPHLAAFAAAFCRSLENVVDNEEKDSAFRGLCQLIATNPSALSSFFPDFINAIGRFHDLSPELNDMFGKVGTTA